MTLEKQGVRDSVLDFFEEGGENYSHPLNV